MEGGGGREGVRRERERESEIVVRGREGIQGYRHLEI
jgi:hypothetical protein